MKLLIITSRFPYPLEKGDKLRLFYQLKELAKYHELVLCAITEETIDEHDFNVVKKSSSNTLIGYLLKSLCTTSIF